MTAQQAPIQLIGPGFMGLNKQYETRTDLGPEWATTATNAVVGKTGRLGARKGWSNQTTTPISGSPNIQQIFEYIPDSGSVQIISAANQLLFSGISTFTDITGTIGPTSNHWQFVNFASRAIGAQTGETMIAWTGSGAATVITPTSGTVPNGNCVLAAFGRLWASNSTGYVVQFCGLLDYQNWGGAGSGSIDLRNIWKGNDTIMGLAAFGSALVIFSQRHIVIFANANGVAGGLDPASMVVTDVISGTGLVARDTVQQIADGDLIYLSPYGLQSLRRAIIQKNNPVGVINAQVQDYMAEFVGLESNKDAIRSVFSPEEKFYLLLLPTSNRIFCVDTKVELENGERRITEWQGMSAHSAVRRTNGQLFLGFNGRVGLHTGYTDNGVAYHFSYASGHLQGPPDAATLLKIGKEIHSVIFSLGTVVVNYKYGYDFQGLTRTVQVTAQGGKIPEYGTAEYGTNGVYNINDPTAVAGTDYSEYGGSVNLRVVAVPVSGDGQWFQVGIDVDINGSDFSIQQLDWHGKLGRHV